MEASNALFLSKCDIFPPENIYFVPSDCEFVGQIGNGGVDHGFWGRPEEMTMDRFDDDDSYDDGDDIYIMMMCLSVCHEK